MSNTHMAPIPDNEVILIIDDDMIVQEILRKVLHTYIIKTADIGEQGIEMLAEFTPNLIIMDVSMSGIDGFETCRRIKACDVTADIPVIFHSGAKTLENRLNGYQVGGCDFICKPFNYHELRSKIQQTLNDKRVRDQLAQQVQSAEEVIMDVQDNAAKMHEIGKFLQESLFFRDFDSLTDRFFQVTMSFGVRCSIHIQTQQQIFARTDDGKNRPIDFEIMEMYHQDPNKQRIKQFGSGRVLYHWEQIILLVKNIGDEIDNTAILLDGLEAGLKAIEAEAMFMQAIGQFREDNYQTKLGITSLFEDMTSALQDVIVKMGFDSLLSEADEDRLMNIILEYRDKVDGKFTQGLRQEEALTKAIERLRAPPVKEEIDVASDEDGIAFF